MSIKLYTTGCPKCLVLEKRLNEDDIGYDKIDSLKEVQEKAKELGINQVPFCLVDGELYGFEEMMERISGE